MTDIVPFEFESKAVERLDEGEKGRTIIPTLAVDREMTIINESSLATTRRIP